MPIPVSSSSLSEALVLLEVELEGIAGDFAGPPGALMPDGRRSRSG